MQVLNNVLEELEVQRIYLAEEIKVQNPKMAAIRSAYQTPQLPSFHMKK